MPYGSSSGSDVLAEATPPVCLSEVASPGPPAPGGAGNSAAQDADCGGNCGTEEEIEGEADCASTDLTQDDTTTSSTTATDATSADGSPSESEPLTPTTPLQLSVPLLPPAEDPNRMTLVLDLDGTLIASEDEPHAPVPFDYCVDEERFVWLRPGLRRFLESVRPMFEVVLFTAAGESWATCAMQRIDPDGRIFDTRLYRDHTVSHDDWPWVKDLSRLGRDLARVVIVDDNPLMFMYQPDNALHVAPYDPQVTGHRDDVLEQVLDVLMHKVLPADDVREVLKHMKDPISPSCVSSRRHVAAKATPGASGMAALKSFLRMNQAVDSSSTGCSSSSTQQAAGASSRHRGGASQGDSAAPRGAEWQTNAGPAGQPGSSRRGRRSRRGGKDGQAQSQHLPQHQQSLSLGMQVQDQGQQATAGGRGGRRKRRSRSQRQAAKVDDTAAAAQALAAQSQAQKQAQNASRRAVVVAQKTASTALQQPDKQLHLKLRLLQLQREQEAQEASVELPGADAAAPCAGGAGAAALASAPLGVRVCAALAAIAKDEDEDNVLEGTIRGGRTVVGRVPVVQGLAASSEPNGAVAEPQQEATAPAPQAARQARQPPMATPLPMPSAWGRPPHRPWGVAPSAAPSAAGSPERSTALSSSVGGAPIAGAAAPGSALPLNYAAVVSAGRSTGHSAQVSVQAAVCTTSVRACSAMDAPAGVDSSAGCDEVSSPRRRSRGRRGRRGRKTPAGADSEEAAEQLSA